MSAAGGLREGCLSACAPYQTVSSRVCGDQLHGEERRVQEEERLQQEHGEPVSRRAAGGDEMGAQPEEKRLVDLEHSHQQQKLSHVSRLEPQSVVEHVAAEEHCGRGLRALDLGDPTSDEPANRLAGREAHRLPVGLRGFLVPSQASQELAPGGVEWVVAPENPHLAERLDLRKAGRGALEMSHPDRAVERDDRRGSARQERVVARDHFRPVGCGEAAGQRVARGDLGLEVVLGELVALGGLPEVLEPAPDHPRVPQRAVLLVQQQQLPGRIAACGKPGGVEEQECGQGVDRGCPHPGVIGQQLRQTDRLVTQVGPYEIVLRPRAE